MNSKFKKVFAGWFWALFAAGVLAVVLFFAMIAAGWIGYIPPVEELQNPHSKYASEVYTVDNVALGRYYLRENRVGVLYSDISPEVINALIATEDARFLSHSGVDAKAFFRALITLGKAGGGSTITQQLSKQLYSPTASNVFQRLTQKPNEWVIAAKLERLYSKEEILTMYLNQFDFLYNAVGIRSASQVYFGTTQDKLKTEQAALLVGMCKNPSMYNPRRHPERALARRNTVLNQMEKYGYLNREACDSLKQIPLELDYHSVDHKDGLAPYFREYLRQYMTAQEPKESRYAEWQHEQYLLDKDHWDNDPLYGFCHKNKKSDGSYYDLYTDGLRIYTTLDSRMQTYAEQAVREHMQYLQTQFFREKKNKSYAPFSRDLSKDEIDGIMLRSMKQTERYRGLKKAGLSEDEIWENFNTPMEMQVFTYDGLKDTIISPLDSIRWQKYFLRCGFMSMDPHNGHIKAYVGGPDFAHFQYDMVSMGRRQVGSTVKPYLYTLAMSEGYWPCDKTINRPITLHDANGREWSPRNGSQAHLNDTVTLMWGLQHSNNWISAYVMSLFGPESLVRMMHQFGITGDIVPVVSLCLGPCEVSVREMVGAYATFPNKGIRVEPVMVTRIEDSKGNLIATFTPRTYEVIDELTSYKMITMLNAVVNGGTGSRVHYYGLNMPMGGKTGTTNNNSDCWFMGFTPSLVSGCWVGGEDRSIHFDNMTHGQGAAAGLPIWALYMKKVYGDSELGYSAAENFDMPEDFDPYEGCRH